MAEYKQVNLPATRHSQAEDPSRPAGAGLSPGPSKPHSACCRSRSGQEHWDGGAGALGGSPRPHAEQPRAQGWPWGSFRPTELRSLGEVRLAPATAGTHSRKAWVRLLPRHPLHTV